MPRSSLFLAPALLVFLVGCAAPISRSEDPEATAHHRSAEERCATLAAAVGSELGHDVTLSSTVAHDASEAAPPSPGSPFGGAPAMPAHCEVVGKANERVGTDGQQYAIGFRLRMPTEWNGRFLFQGGGGTDGNLGDAIGGVGVGAPTALDRGFAVVSTDAGHDNRTNSDPERQGSVAFGFDYEARLDYAERSLEVVADVGRALVTAFYNQAPDNSYFFGCSNGGRQGMIFAQRFPDKFDGIVATAPAFDVPRAAVAQAWDTQVFARLARQMDLVDEQDEPLIHRTFSDDDLAIVSDAVLEACDGLDGLVDGIVGDFNACTTERVRPELDRKTCTGDKSPDCLLPEQVDALVDIFAGPFNSQGEPLYSDWAWDAGIGGKVGETFYNGWRMWKLGLYDGGFMRYPINITLGSPALSALFITPPTPIPDNPSAHLAYQLEFDFDTDAPKLYATTPEFPRSSFDLISARATDMSAFRDRGGRMIIPHGVSDPVFSIHDTRRWWEAVDGATVGQADDFVRLFAVPGMAHCGGGPATDSYDALTAIVDWVEEGSAPDRIEASAGDMSPWPDRTRPLCPYPLVAQYTGSGSIEESQNFECR